MQNVNKLPDDKLRNESNSAVNNEIEATETAVVDVFTVSFWERGVPGPETKEAKPVEAKASVDITVDGETYLDTSKN